MLRFLLIIFILMICRSSFGQEFEIKNTEFHLFVKRLHQKPQICNCDLGSGVVSKSPEFMLKSGDCSVFRLCGIPVKASNKLLIKPQPKPEDKWFGRDKAKHFLASMIITGGSMWVAKNRWGINKDSSRNFGVSVGISAGFVKEILDKKGKTSHFSLRDISADFLGVIVGSTLLSW